MNANGISFTLNDVAERSRARLPGLTDELGYEAETDALCWYRKDMGALDLHFVIGMLGLAGPAT